MQDLQRFRNEFWLVDWFDRWLEVLGPPMETADETWPPPLRRLVTEVASDASPEQFLNPLTAAHLRRHGRKLAQDLELSRQFWVRSEWEKVDLSYGLAGAFSDNNWDRAWSDHETGDLGQCEVKVCYTHQYKGKVAILADQLTERHKRDQLRKAPGRAFQRYHGLIWLFQLDGIDKMAEVGGEIEAETGRHGLTVVRSFNLPARADNLGALWPGRGHSDYGVGLAAALVELEG